MTGFELVAALALLAILAGLIAQRTSAQASGRETFASKRSLPLLADSHLAQRVGLRPKRCAQCRYWHWQRGQEALRANPAFFQAAQWLSPEQMSRTGTGFDDGAATSPESNVENAPPDAPLERYGRPIDWSEFGACMHPEGPAGEGPESTHSDFSCERWT